MSKVTLMNNTRLADIAAQAGVSEATVSRVLNGKAGSPRPPARPC
ncbi:hypothetical protein GCM10027612_54770 [Microbispora bryophytorum subsp. camponoti]